MRTLGVQLVRTLIMVVTASLVLADPISAVTGISRTLEPVILKGSALPAYLGAQTDQIFVYAYSGGNWRQLPAQVDEVDAGGNYVGREDGLLDDNDEIVFMARDLGDRSGGAAPVPGKGTIVTSWYELAVTDPTRSSDQGWAYVVQSASVVPVQANDYVTFDATQHRVIGSNYVLGFASPHRWSDYLALGGSGVDILDRFPKYWFCRGILCFNENLSSDVEDGLVKDGPVRLILRDGRILAYGWTASSSLSITIPASLAPDYIRFSSDFNTNATGATFYNADVPAGVLVDGVPDTVPSAPFSPWSQLSTGAGTFIEVADPGELGGTPTTYYVDDSRIDNLDSGDKQHYGDNGLRVAQPNLSFTLRYSLYFLDGAQPNVGATYAGYFVHPLTVTAQRQDLVSPIHSYLPMLLR